MRSKLISLDKENTKKDHITNDETEYENIAMISNQNKAVTKTYFINNNQFELQNEILIENQNKDICNDPRISEDFKWDINEIHQLMTDWQSLLFAIQKSFDITWKQILNFEENATSQSESQLHPFNVLDQNKVEE